VFDLEEVGLETDLKSSIKKFNIQVREWKDWAEIPMTMAVYDRVMRSMHFGARAVEEIEDQIWDGDYPTADGPQPITLWAFYNVLTWHITHRAASLNHRIDMEQSSGWQPKI
jgi:hypothetical protein